MPHSSWNESYASGESLPWDTGTPDPQLVELIVSRVIVPGRTLEIGCGTGTNAIFLAQRGFDVLGIDISEAAVEKARAKAHGVSLRGRRFSRGRAGRRPIPVRIRPRLLSRLRRRRRPSPLCAQCGGRAR
jgi:SAM-dependent methyltransferase